MKPKAAAIQRLGPTRSPKRSAAPIITKKGEVITRAMTCQGGVPLAKAIVKAVSRFDKPEILAEVSAGLGEAMPGISLSDMPEADRMARRGW